MNILALRNTCTQFRRIVDTLNLANLKLKIQQNDLNDGKLLLYEDIELFASRQSIQVDFDINNLNLKSQVKFLSKFSTKFKQFYSEEILTVDFGKSNSPKAEKKESASNCIKSLYL